ncbi:MAG TPA: ABC transporter substrate-binding protein [Devosia sp.]|nr:ABC transporter substrate-binding protein [Devosia sp.]
MFDLDFAVVTETADGDDVVKAAERLVNEQKVFALAGGFDHEEALALSQWTAAHNVPFLNIGASSDVLRNEQCAATTFHLAPSAAMYLDALAGWYVRAGFRKWYFVQADSDEGKAQYDRAMQSISDRHFGAREAGHTIVAAGAPLPDDALTEIKQSGADMVVMLVSGADQLTMLAQMEAAGIEAAVTGFPFPETQTRAFFEASRQAAPQLGTGMRATEWEPTLDAYGARELNARYQSRWHEPMESSAWATYQAVKIFYEAAIFTSSIKPKDVIAYMEAPETVFDVWKGIGTSFRPWDRQLRQSLFLVKIDEKATDPKLVGQLVGELPAIYMPGTDPIERLDQLGDLEGQSRCQQ